MNRGAAGADEMDLCCVVLGAVCVWLVRFDR